MVIRLVTLAVFVVLASAVVMTETLRTAGLQSVLIATAVLALAIFLPSAALSRFVSLLRPLVVLIVAAPALWMVLQVIPMPIRELVNPIWSIASAALNEPLDGRITVDVPATLLSLAQYCVVLATALVTAVIAVDSQRAAGVLYILVSITTVLATAGIVGGGTTDFAVAAVLGVILSGAMMIGPIDQARRLRWPLRRGTVFTLAAAVLSFLVCSTAILTSRKCYDHHCRPAWAGRLACGGRDPQMVARPLAQSGRRCGTRGAQMVLRSLGQSGARCGSRNRAFCFHGYSDQE